jgi:prevent-host-death family protein
MTMMTRVTRAGAGRRDNSASESGFWTVATAKAHLSALIDRARDAGPQTITRHGRPMAVVVSADEWERKTRRVGTLAEFFAASPLREAPDLVLERSPELPRDNAL